jgi:hypothetical protein
MALLRSSDRSDRDRAGGMALTIQIVVEHPREVDASVAATSSRRS